MKRLRLLEVTVQGVFVEDDGTDLVQHISQPMKISGKDWAKWAAEAFTEEGLAKIHAQISGPPIGEDDVSEVEK